MKVKIIYLVFILPFGFFLCMLLGEAYLHIFSDLTLEGKVVSVSPPGGEYQFSVYSIDYYVKGVKFTTNNTGSLSENIKVGDSIALIIDKDNPSNAVIKGSYKGLLIPIILILILEIGLLFSFIKTFQPK